MALCADDLQTSGFPGLIRQPDVRTPAGHVGGDSHGPGFTGMPHNLRFFFVKLRIQELVIDPLYSQHPA